MASALKLVAWRFVTLRGVGPVAGIQASRLVISRLKPFRFGRNCKLCFRAGLGRNALDGPGQRIGALLGAFRALAIVQPVAETGGIPPADIGDGPQGRADHAVAVGAGSPRPLDARHIGRGGHHRVVEAVWIFGGDRIEKLGVLPDRHLIDTDAEGVGDSTKALRAGSIAGITDSHHLDADLGRCRCGSDAASQQKACGSEAAAQTASPIHGGGTHAISLIRMCVKVETGE